jgi:hypothetical protein
MQKSIIIAGISLIIPCFFHLKDFGRGQKIIEKRRKIKQQTLLKRRMDFILNN